MLLDFAQVVKNFMVQIFNVLSFEVQFFDAISVPFIDIIVVFLAIGFVVNVFWKGAQT